MANENTQINIDEFGKDLSREELVAIIKQLQEQMSDISANTLSVGKFNDIMEDIRYQNIAITACLNQINSAQDIEHTILFMQNAAKETLQTEGCKVFILDNFEQKLYTIDNDFDRQYIDIDKDSGMMHSLLTQAFINGEPSIVNQLGNENIGADFGMEIHNAIAVPLKVQNNNKSEEVIGVVLAVNKNDEILNQKDFSERDIDTFDLQKGVLGAAYRAGIENKYLKEAATLDNLTRIPNRNGLDDYIKHNIYDSLTEAEANHISAPVSAIMIDIDHFKDFNDTYGHTVGDRVLYQVAQILKDVINKDDCAARYGGEEFIVVSPKSEQETIELAERIRKAIAETPIFINGIEKQITVSLGVAEAPKNLLALADNDRSTLIKRFDSRIKEEADKNLYISKENGRNTVTAKGYGTERSDFVPDKFIFDKIITKLDTNPYPVNDKTTLAVMRANDIDGITVVSQIKAEGEFNVKFGGKVYTNANELPKEAMQAYYDHNWAAFQVNSTPDLYLYTKAYDTVSKEEIYPEQRKCVTYDFAELGRDGLRETLCKESAEMRDTVLINENSKRYDARFKTHDYNYQDPDTTQKKDSSDDFGNR